MDAKEFNTAVLTRELLRRMVNSKKEKNGWTSILFDYYINLKDENKQEFLSILEYLKIMALDGRLFDFKELSNNLNIFEIGFANLEYSEVTLKNMLMGEKKTGYFLVKFYTPTENITRIRKETGM